VEVCEQVVTTPISLRDDCRPLCLEHVAEMREDTTQWGTGTESVLTTSKSYSCREPGCDLNWERRLGYFRTASVTRTFQFGIQGIRCSITDHLYLYLAEVQTENWTRIWRCSVKGCEYFLARD
jgi:hypothetical protein